MTAASGPARSYEGTAHTVSANSLAEHCNQGMRDTSLPPRPRDFNNLPKSNRQLSWGGKFEQQCVRCNTPDELNCLVGDSFAERLGWCPPLLPLYQSRFAGYVNLGCGGDKAENVLWRLQHGALPENPGQVLLFSGSNNLRDANSKSSRAIADTILKTVSLLHAKFPSINITVFGILPRENIEKCKSAEQVNSILNFKLPQSVTFIQPPRCLYSNGLPNYDYFEDDGIHLNKEGYQKLFDCLPGGASHSSTAPINPVADEFGISQLEFLGAGWTGETPPEPARASLSSISPSLPSSPA